MKKLNPFNNQSGLFDYRVTEYIQKSLAEKYNELVEYPINLKLVNI
jgi:hypothetical protein